MDDRYSLFNGHTARAIWPRPTIPTVGSSVVQRDRHGTCVRYDIFPSDISSLLEKE